MKRILFLLAVIFTCHASAQVKVCQLPSTSIGSINDYIIKEDSDCTNGTKKMTIEDFFNAYGINYDTSLGGNYVKTDGSVVGATGQSQVFTNGITLPSLGSGGMVGYRSDGTLVDTAGVPKRIRYFGKTGRDSSDAGFTRISSYTHISNKSGADSSYFDNTPTLQTIMSKSGTYTSSIVNTPSSSQYLHSAPTGIFGIAMNDSDLSFKSHSVVLKWPRTDGTAGQVLKTDGAGALGWASVSDSAWGLQGNAGTNPATDFIGTTDNKDLVFKVNNANAGIITNNDSLNASFGIYSLYQYSNSTHTGLVKENVAIGTYSLVNLINGQSNTAIGSNAGAYLKNGDPLDTSSANLFLGVNTTLLNKTVTSSAAIGFSATVGCGNCTVIGDTMTTHHVGIGYSTPSAILGANTGLAVAGNIYAKDTIFGNGKSFLYGTFTPTISDSTNVDATSISVDAMWMKLGNIVTVTYHINVDPNTTVTTTSITLDYPASLPANPSANASGVGSWADDVATTVGANVTPIDATTLKVSWTPVATTSKVLSFTVTYQSN